jgi:hypothetical protein
MGHNYVCWTKIQKKEVKDEFSRKFKLANFGASFNGYWLSLIPLYYSVSKSS